MEKIITKDYNTTFAIKIEVTSNADDWAHFSHSLFGEGHGWDFDGQTPKFGSEIYTIFIDLIKTAVEEADKVTVAQLTSLAKEAHKNGFAMLELFYKSYDDGFFGAVIAIEAKDEDTF